MAHTTEIVKYEKLSSSQFAVHFRCCGNAATDYSLTLDSAVAADAERRQAALDSARKACADLHQKAVDAEAGVIGEMGKTVEHI